MRGEHVALILFALFGFQSKGGKDVSANVVSVAFVPTPARGRGVFARYRAIVMIFKLRFIL